MTKIVIDRKMWLRGDGGINSRLLREKDNKMCCWGFACEQIGVPRSQMVGMSTVYAIRHSLPESFAVLGNNDDTTRWVREAYTINDAVSIQDDERESRLTKIFAENGFELEFIN